MNMNTARIGEGNKVLVIGAGCTGLALAHGLKKVQHASGYYESGIHPCFQDSEVIANNLHLLLLILADAKHRLEYLASCTRGEAM